MSMILFYTLYSFYRGLKVIGLKFKMKGGILTAHVVAFSLPIFAGIAYVICITKFNQAAIFTSTRATAEDWSVLGASYCYLTVMATV